MRCKFCDETFHDNALEEIEEHSCRQSRSYYRELDKNADKLRELVLAARAIVANWTNLAASKTALKAALEPFKNIE